MVISILGKAICLSICEAEVMAAVAASIEAIHLKLLLGELGINHDKLIVEEDNAACIAKAKGGLRFIRKAKHYQIALRFIQKLHVDAFLDYLPIGALDGLSLIHISEPTRPY